MKLAEEASGPKIKRVGYKVWAQFTFYFFEMYIKMWWMLKPFCNFLTFTSDVVIRITASLLRIRNTYFYGQLSSVYLISCVCWQFSAVCLISKKFLCHNSYFENRAYSKNIILILISLGSLAVQLTKISQYLYFL